MRVYTAVNKVRNDMLCLGAPDQEFPDPAGSMDFGTSLISRNW